MDLLYKQSSHFISLKTRFRWFSYVIIDVTLKIKNIS